MEREDNFNKALYGIAEDLRVLLQKLSLTVKGSCEEIRLRVGLPLALTVEGETVFVRKDGSVSFSLQKDLPIVSRTMLEQSFRLICGSSVYAHGEELKEGFVIMKNGCRAGICGGINKDGELRNITSVNIRIAREVLGAANDIISGYKGGGLLIAGPPGSGKTTILRDLIRQLSIGNTGRILRVSVIDSRGEISGSSLGDTANDLGASADILMLEDKAKGVEIALRTMNPDIIAFDEIGDEAELRRVEESFFSGVSVITTAHIGDISELLSRRVTGRLLKSGIIEQVALLPSIHRGKIKLYSSKELFKGVAV